MLGPQAAHCRQLPESNSDHYCLCITSQCYFTSFRTLYDIVVEPQYENGVVAPHVEHVQCLIPGCPDAPVIWLRAIESNEFVIEWAEPRLYGFKCAGYQVR
jgi:hypothetical protein